MKKVVFFSLLMVLIGLSSCVKNSSEYKALQAQRDSLALVNAHNATELDDILSLLNDIEENFREMKTAENYLSVQSSTPGEKTPSTKESIKSNMNFIKETLDRNRTQIDELEKKLKNSSVQSAQLQKNLTMLRKQLDEKTEALTILQDELQRKNYEISKLNDSVKNLVNDVSELESQAQIQEEVIKKQQAELNMAYYCFGTSNELKEQKILEGSKLGANFNRAYFTKIEDINHFSTIPLYAKKGQLVSKHPEGSYEFIKDSDNKAVLKIIDPKNFWSLTKYLVIQVNV